METLTFGTSFFGTKFDWIFLLTLAVPSDLITENVWQIRITGEVTWRAQE
jgi:hypothetical protein